ncbi:tellurium resistance protein TerY [Spirochaetia bacterium]|nr:tellurium resistance protein TerY [Spirochaetia bacterium]
MTELQQRGFTEEVPKIINPNEPHMALVFLLDTSGSMGGPPIDNLNKGLNRFKEEACKSQQTRDILDVAIIEFNSNYRIVQEFVPVEYMDEVNLSVTGSTQMSPAIRKALEMVTERSRFYRRAGTDPYKPWVILVSDGAPDSNDDINAVAQEIKQMEEGGYVSFRSLGVEGYDPATLHKLCGPKVMKLEGYDFTSFFDWVNKSMRSVSVTAPGEKPQAQNVEGNVTVDRSTDWD